LDHVPGNARGRAILAVAHQLLAPRNLLGAPHHAIGHMVQRGDDALRPRLDHVVDRCEVGRTEPPPGLLPRFTPLTATGCPVLPVSISASISRCTLSASSPVTRGSRPVRMASTKSAITARW